MDKKTIKTNSCFFAAANGYSGFRSYFDSIFSPEDLDRLYVVKGGPGTGKSSLMRRLENALYDRNYKTEVILCSSDPNSLDGVIASKDGKRIAILDGTAPHEKDAKYPGAKDSLIPLGEAWDQRYLYAQKETITSISKEKSNAYKAAYGYLKIAGEADAFIKRIILNNIDVKKMRLAAKSLAEDLKYDVKGDLNVRLISAFGKGGYTTLPTLEKVCDRVIYIGGRREYAIPLIGELLNRYLCESVKVTRIPSPLNDTDTEALYLPDANIAIVASEKGDTKINLNDMINANETDNERIRVAENLRAYSLDEASRWHGIASDFHFRLEEIYSRAMDFEKVNGFFEKTLSEIQAL